MKASQKVLWGYCLDPSVALRLHVGFDDDSVERLLEGIMHPHRMWSSAKTLWRDCLNPSIALPLQVGLGEDFLERLFESKLCTHTTSSLRRRLCAERLVESKSCSRTACSLRRRLCAEIAWIQGMHSHYRGSSAKTLWRDCLNPRHALTLQGVFGEDSVQRLLESKSCTPTACSLRRRLCAEIAWIQGMHSHCM